MLFLKQKRRVLVPMMPKKDFDTDLTVRKQTKIDYDGLMAPMSRHSTTLNIPRARTQFVCPSYQLVKPIL